MSTKRVSVIYYSDILCIWAYVAQIRVDELRRHFSEQVSIDYRFVPVFGSVQSRIDERWADRGGLAGYAKHVKEVAGPFDHAELHPDAWTKNVPAGSFGAHVFVKALAIGDESCKTFGERTVLEELLWRLRLAFFRDLRDIGRLDVQLDVAETMDLDTALIRRHLDDGSALAALAEDHDFAARHQVTGSPTYLLNEGRQKIYGNVGYRIIEANIQELLRDDRSMASWC
jgi:predicted DsbA family dithiol-disulfide isomerase